VKVECKPVDAVDTGQQQATAVQPPLQDDDDDDGSGDEDDDNDNEDQDSDDDASVLEQTSSNDSTDATADAPLHTDQVQDLVRMHDCRISNIIIDVDVDVDVW
jgi:hypothetical protein